MFLPSPLPQRASDRPKASPSPPATCTFSPMHCAIIPIKISAGIDGYSGNLNRRREGKRLNGQGRMGSKRGMGNRGEG